MKEELFNNMLEIETSHWWFVSRRKIISNLIEKLNLRPDSSIFDVGCGNGDNLEMLSKFGNVEAMEKNSNALNNARGRNIGNVFCGELPDKISNEINLNNDLVVMLDVLEHIDDDTSCLDKLKNWTDTDGYLFITVPAYQFLWTYHDEIHHHKRRYTAGVLKKLVIDNGWNVKYISYFNTFLFPVALLQRMISKILPVRQDDLIELPGRRLNTILGKIFSAEKYFLGKVSFPFGLSIVLIATKANN